MKLSTWLKLNLSFYRQLDRLKDWYVWKFENPYNLNMPNGQCPVQIEGQLDDGKYYYFRARGSQWSLSIAEKELDVVMVKERLFNYKEKYGNTFEAGWMFKREAIRFATKALNKYYGRNCDVYVPTRLHWCKCHGAHSSDECIKNHNVSHV